VSEDTWPDGFYFIGELRRAVGLFDGAMEISPKEAWEQAIAEVERVREIASQGYCRACEERNR
jgi:hypothetical protein